MVQAIMSDITKYPGVDWNRCLELTDNNESLAEDLLNMFVDSLPQEWGVLQVAFAAENYEGLKNQAHKIHGALCYCGIPNMKDAVSDLERACIALLKSEQDANSKRVVADSYRRVQNEVDTLLRFISV